MNQQILPNGWHCDALPDGAFVVLIPNQHVLTHFGPIAFKTPERQPLFPRIAESGPFRFAGQSWGTAETLEYDGAWQLHPAPCGVSPVIYDNAGTLRISDCSIGSQGYRYNDPSQVDPITGDATYGPSPQAPKLYEWTDLGRNGDVLVVGQGDQGGVVLWDGTTHRLVASGSCRFIRAHRSGDQVSIAFYRELGGTTTESELVWATVAELRALPPVPQPVPDHFGPVSDPRPNGYVIADTARFMVGDSATFPRKTDHTVTQHIANGRVYWGKFYDPSIGEHGKGSYEEYVIGEKFVHLIVDKSLAHKLVTTDDTRWLPRQCKVGTDHLFKLPRHVLIEKHPQTCAETHRQDWDRQMGIWQSFERFDCGRDLGVREVIVVLYDNTGDFWAPERGIELYWYADEAACLRWEWHRSDRVRENGGWQFNDYTLGMRKDFYHFGGTSWVPTISPCVIPPSPETPPVPPIPPVPPMTTDTLKPGALLHVDKPLVSQDKRFTFLYQSDGNLVLYGPSGPLWATATTGTSVGFCAMQGDGNFVLYDKSTRPRWASGTVGHPTASLIAQNDGNVVIYSMGGPIWATGTVYQPTPPPNPGPGPGPGPGPVTPVVPVRVDGKVFRRPDNTIYNSRSASSFLLLRRLLEEGEAPVREYLAQFHAIGARELRVFSRVNWSGNPGPGLFPENYPNYWSQFNRLFTLAAEQGMYLEMVALTGPEVGAGWVQQCQEQRSKHVNAFLEITNEPHVNGIDIERIMEELGGSTGSWSQPWSTGQYYPTALPGGSFCTVHTDRVDGWEWVRKAIKDILEYREGGGPYNPTDPEMARPIKGDEPMCAASFYKPGSRDMVPVHHFTAAAGSHLFGAGYCVHHFSGLNSIFPSGVELECVTAAFKGMDTVGPEWQLGEYGRVGLPHFPVTDDPSVRTYGMRLGNRWKVVRVGPTTALPVLSTGWRVDKVDSYAGLNVVLELVSG